MQPSSQQHKIVLHHPMKPTNHHYKTFEETEVEDI
jgi:hypothetical protein